MSTQHDAFELGMHSAFRKAGVKTQKQAALLFKKAGEMIAQRQAQAKAFAAYELGLRKTAADNGLLSTEEQDAFVEAARKVAAEKVAAYNAVKNTGDKLLGLLKGALGTGAHDLREVTYAYPMTALGTAAVAGGAAGHSMKSKPKAAPSKTQTKAAPSKTQTKKTAALGAIIGALRKKDPGESRTHSVLRSAGTDAATWLGGDVGAIGGAAAGGLAAGKLVKGPGARELGALLKGPHSPESTAAIQKGLARLAKIKGGIIGGAVGGGALGAAGAYNMAKRKPDPKGLAGLKAKLMGLTKKGADKSALFGGTSAGEDVRSVGNGISGLAQKIIAKIKQHPTASAATGGVLAGGLLGAHMQKKRDLNRVAG